MYGMVHQAARGMALDVLGEDAWAKILDRCGLDETHFVSAQTYDDGVTMGLVGAICEVANMEPATLLKAFGEYWITFAGNSAYGPLMDQFGDTLEEFIENLDAMHVRIQAAMPGADMPSFEVLDAGADKLEVAYRSNRSGLEPFVVGLLTGLSERFGEQATVSYRIEEDAAVFTIGRDAGVRAA